MTFGRRAAALGTSAETRESQNNIVSCDDNVEVIQSLEEREPTLL
jgi:hypothetical protein